MPAIRKDLYIQLLKYADHKVEFTMQELFNDLNLNQEEKDLFAWQLIHNKLLFDNVRISANAETIFTISVEGKFKLLEYEELTEARISSKEAKKQAFRAIIISWVFALASILLQWLNSVSLEGKQFYILIKTIKHQQSDHVSPLKKDPK